MDKLKRMIALLLAMLMVLSLFAGCASEEKTDDEIYLTKGEFFAYFVYDNNLTSSKYTAEEIQNCMDGSVEADIIVEWGYLSEELAKDDLDDPVEKEIVVMVCANACIGLNKGDVSDIKDADLLEDPQLIADAYASGFFELDNGYFDGAAKVSFTECDEIMDAAKSCTASFHYEANTEVTEVSDDLFVQDDSNYQTGDIEIEFITDTSAEASELSYGSDNGYTVTALGAANDGSKVATLGASTSAAEATPLVNKTIPNITGFKATIQANTFEKSLGNPKVGDIVKICQYDIGVLSTDNRYRNGTIIGILTSVNHLGTLYECTFEYPDFEQAVEVENVSQANKGMDIIDESSFDLLETKVDGWKIDVDFSKSGLTINAEKDFTMYETGRKQDWQNAKHTVTAKASFEMNDFNIDTNNLRSFAKKNGDGFIKITCDTKTTVELSQSLRYTPDDNRNGKFPSNWNNSRWTDQDAAGAKRIKVAKFTPSLDGIVGMELNIYLLITCDGKISFECSVDDGGVMIKVHNGNISRTDLGKKSTALEAQVNLRTRFGIDAKVLLFSFINVIEYDVGFNLDIYAAVNLYYDEELKEEGVCADEEGLNEYRQYDGKFGYCVGVTITGSVSGSFVESGIKLINNFLSDGKYLDFEKELFTTGFHIEDGEFVDECTRGNEVSTDDLEESDDNDIGLSAYKVTVSIGSCAEIKLTDLPKDAKQYVKSKNSITVSSKDEDICTVSYNKKKQCIIIEGTGEGSTEIVIKAKKGALWWKKSIEQEISVTSGYFSGRF